MAFNNVESSKDKSRHNVRETWDIDDESFSYAPRKPCGNPWDEILRPLMEKDHIQCSAWKEEVQNLLIFAGLFSAVVTAFIIESYKLLQPAPPLSDQLTSILIDALLSQTNSTLSVPSISTVPNSSAIRVNIFWFTSLMLSLATVLIGIISLQWLREYQSYPNLSALEKLALFNMRSEAFERWHIKGIFTTLPLLLQIALVLFFAGIIDFLSHICYKVAIPVTVIIAVTLFFLAATTILPTLQIVSLYFSSRNHLRSCPTYSQCPYKSPQSHAFCSICTSVLYGLTCIYRTFKRIRLSSAPFLPQTQTFGISFLGKENLHLFPFLFSAFTAPTWMHFDLAWLSIRDACSHASFDPLPGLIRLRSCLKSGVPLYDTSRALRKAISDNSSSAQLSEVWFPVIYHCHQNLADSFLRNDAFVRASHSDDAFDDIQRCYSYFSSLVDIEHSGYRLTVQDGGPREHNIGAARDIAKSIKHTMYICNLFGFLRMARGYFLTNDLRRHILEVKIRLMKAFYGPRHDYYIRPTQISILLPPSLKIYHRDMLELRGQEEYSNFYWQYHHVLLDYFKAISHSNQSDFPDGSLHSHTDIIDFLKGSARHTYTVCSSDSLIYIPSQDRRTELWGAFGRVLDYISESLLFDLNIVITSYKDNHANLQIDTNVKKPDQSLSKKEPTCVHLFFASAIYVQHLLEIHPRWRQRTFAINENLYNLMHIIREYKEMLAITGFSLNTVLEERIHTNPVARFSIISWSFLDNIPESRSNASSRFQGIVQNSIHQAIPRHQIIESNAVKGPDDFLETPSRSNKEPRTESRNQSRNDSGTG